MAVPFGLRPLRRSAGAVTLALLVLVLAAAVPLEAALPQAELDTLLAEAGSLFHQGNEASLSDPASARDLYLRAALRYERIIREGGIRNGKLFYNAGNAYFLAGDIGRAILNYRRAELHLGGDPNLAQNLRYARSQRVDRFEEKQERQVLRTLLFWHYDFAAKLRLLLLLLFSGAFWTAAAVRLLRPAWIPRLALFLAGGLALLFLGSVVVEAASDGGREAGVILAQQVVARKGDGGSYEPSFNDPLHAGAEFRVIETRGDWRHIELPDGRDCWIPAAAAGLISGL